MNHSLLPFVLAISNSSGIMSVYVMVSGLAVEYPASRRVKRCDFRKFDECPTLHDGTILLIERYLFILLSVTVAIQGHNTVKQSLKKSVFVRLG